MQLRKCDYCGTEYNAAMSKCPLCGKPADPNAPIEDETAPASVPHAANTNADRYQHVKKRKGDRIPAGFWIASCAVLAVAVLIGAIYFLYAMGLFTSEDKNDIHMSDTIETQKPEEETVNGELEELPVVDEAEDTGRACTALTLSQESVTLEEKGGYFFLTVLAEPSDCDEPVTFVSSDPEVVEVSGNISSCMITAVAPGEAVIEVTCGQIVEYCTVTCDFEQTSEPDETTPDNQPDVPDQNDMPDDNDQTEVNDNTDTQPNTPAQPDVQPTLSSVDFTMFAPGEQYTLMVNDAPEGAAISFHSSDTKVVTVNNNGLVTAVGSGSSTITVKVNDLTLTCIARCNMDTSAETGTGTGPVDNGDPNAVYIISHVDVTLKPNDKTFQITLTDENGQAVTGETWTSTKTGVCTVDAAGKVTAVGTGTAEVQTTYGGKTYTCIVRCHMD